MLHIDLSPVKELVSCREDAPITSAKSRVKSVKKKVKTK